MKANDEITNSNNPPKPKIDMKGQATMMNILKPWIWNTVRMRLTAVNKKLSGPISVSTSPWLTSCMIKLMMLSLLA